ncbi:helix-turn-helix and ligand-binding sensor domain-containing protein [Candidatus Bacteroides intestinigallinarum]|uniref:helix-turn-helix and ligand-binding sensor domain-containing protein n=1 Tax=Candidatus Bacteroides intestinigallinarum TaxID=2838470 RepID=UPI0021668CD0|nr:sigma-70 region 4 domain-containing protein [Candidatus Bacteroides intestinigallinarum]MCS3200735.1 sigma-70 region 4 domain-containing protein [Candidatus Bacteroides intestinigallinarum]
MISKPVRFYTPSEYKSDAQVWSISKGEEDDVYFATNEGIVLYDGVRWEKYVTPSECIMRSVFYDEEDKIMYSGGVNEFGYWKYDEYGNLEYTLLYENSPSSPTQEFWKIAKVPGSQLVYFESPLSLLVYDTKAGKITPLADDGIRFHFLFIVGKKVYLQQSNYLYQLDGYEKRMVTDQLENFYLVYMTLTSGGKLRLFSSEKGSLVLDDKGNIEKRIPYELDMRITSMGDLGNDYLVGTGNTGFYRMDEEGNILSRVGEQLGLKNTVLSVGVNNKGDIWLGLNGGIMMIEESVKEESLLLDPKENIGYVYCAVNQNEQLYVGTNKGLFKINKRDDNVGFTLIPQSKGQVWNLYNIGDEVIVAHNKGLFGVSNATFREIKHSGVYTLVPVPSHPGYYISGNYVGLSLYKLKDGKLMFQNNISGYGDLVQNCAFDKDGNLWITHSRREYMRLRFDDDYTTVIESEIYTVPTTKSKRAFLVKVGNDIIFLNNEGGVYKYNELNNTLQPDEYNATLLEAINRNALKVQAFDDRFWQMNEEGVCLLQKNYNKVVINAGLFARMKDEFIPKGFRKVIQLEDSIYAIGLENGLGIMNITALNGQPPMKMPRIRKAEIVGESENKLLSLKEGNLFIPAHINMVRLWLTSLNRGQQVEYRIVERGDKWETSSGGYIQLSYLHPGDFTLEVRNSNGYGIYSEVNRIMLHVASPWYATVYAYLFYGLFVIGIVFLIYRAVLVRTRKKEEEIRLNEERKRQEEMERYQLNCLQEELGNKNSKLMSITMLGVQNNTFLKKKKDAVQEIDTSQSPATKQQVQRLVKDIERQLNDQSGWDNFAEHFNNTCNGFFDRLTEKHPKLTNSDLRLCAYIRLNLSTKEIASLMNVSSSSVEMAKYRLRKKLELDESVALPYYLTEVIATLKSFVNN